MSTHDESEILKHLEDIQNFCRIDGNEMGLRYFGPEEDENRYPLYLDEIDTPLKLLWQIEHLSEKTWMSNRRYKTLIQVATSHFGWSDAPSS